MKYFLFLAALFTLPPAAQATVLIDNFESAQNLAIAPGTSNADDGIAAGGLIGGARFATLSTFGFVNPTGTTTVVIDDSNDGILALTPEDADDIQLQLIYDGNSGAHAGPDGGGLGGINLMASGDLTFQIVARSTAEVDGSLFLYTASTSNFYRYNFKFPALGVDVDFSTISIDLSLYDQTSGAGFLPTSLGAIDLIIDTQLTSGLVQIDEMRFVPEPSAAVLAVSGLVGLLFWRRFRRGRRCFC